MLKMKRAWEEMDRKILAPQDQTLLLHSHSEEKTGLSCTRCRTLRETPELISIYLYLEVNTKAAAIKVLSWKSLADSIVS
jgi:hypothetical protein